MEQTLAIIKPGFVSQAGNIISMIQDRGFEIKNMKMMWFTKEQAKQFYAEHDGKDFFPGLVEYTTSAPVIAMILEGGNAIKRYRNLMGATEPRKAGGGTLRGLFGKGVPHNAVHGSDSVEAARREIALVFK